MNGCPFAFGCPCRSVKNVLHGYGSRISKATRSSAHKAMLPHPRLAGIAAILRARAITSSSSVTLAISASILFENRDVHGILDHQVGHHFQVILPVSQCCFGNSGLPTMPTHMGCAVAIFANGFIGSIHGIVFLHWADLSRHRQIGGTPGKCWNWKSSASLEQARYTGLMMLPVQVNLMAQMQMRSP